MGWRRDGGAERQRVSETQLDCESLRPLNAHRNGSSASAAELGRDRGTVAPHRSDRPSRTALDDHQRGFYEIAIYFCGKVAGAWFDCSVLDWSRRWQL